MFAYIEKNDRERDEEFVGVKYIGKTRGCGCCSREVAITPENIQEHIKGLEDELEKAREIQKDL